MGLNILIFVKISKISSSKGLTLASISSKQKNEGTIAKDKKVIGIQQKKCLILNNFFSTGSKHLMFCERVIFDMNIVYARNHVNICFGFEYIDVSFLKMVPFFNKQLQENL